MTTIGEVIAVDAMTPNGDPMSTTFSQELINKLPL
jgi:hypothetical protein